MGFFSRFARARQAQSCTLNSTNNLGHVGSKAAVAIAATCGTALVICSAGFGGLYAWSAGSQHGAMLGALSVAMAVALEGAKPLALAGAFAAFRSWAVVRGFALLLLAAAAVAFSLMSELALIGGSRGDLTAKREAQIEQGDARRTRLQVARKELTELAPSRSKAEIEADIAKLLARNSQTVDCRGDMSTPVARWVCPRVATLKGEIGRGEKRDQLQGVIDRLTIDGPSTGGATGKADPASAALSTYLAMAGVTVAASTLSEWLLLLPVLALELGAALAMILVEAIRGGSARSVQESATTRSDDPGAVDTPKGKARTGGPSNGRGRPAREREAAERKITDTIKAKGGKLSAKSVRRLGSMLGVRKSTMHSALSALIAAGVVAKIGTDLVLSG